MRLTIGHKLGLGFGGIIALLVASTGVAYLKLAQMDASIEDVTERSFVAARASDAIETRVNRSLAALRGYLLMGDAASLGESFDETRVRAWTQIAHHVETLDRAFLLDSESKRRESVRSLRRVLDELRQTQDKIVALAFKPGNVPALDLLLDEATPAYHRMSKLLSGLAEELDGDTTDGERASLRNAVADAHRTLAASVAALRSFVLVRGLQGSDSPDELEFRRNWADHAGLVRKVDSASGNLSARERNIWESFSQLHESYSPLPARIIALRKAPHWNRAEHLLEADAVPAVARVRSISEDLATALGDRLNASKARLARDSAAMRFTLITSSVMALVIGSLVAVMLSRRIVTSIQAVVDGAKRISEGDLSGQPIEVTSHDEVGMLAGSFNEMLASLRGLTSQIREVTSSVSSSSTEILAAAQQQASSTRQQAATLQQISSTMQELSLSGEQVRERAAGVASMAESTADAGARGVRAVTEAAEGMETIREQVEQVAENIVGLSERTQTIGEIISAVNDMSEQSNLLALNASIEAVSAGEEGSRFGVVASEMKSLADQAKQSTLQVRSILGEIQRGINTSVMMTEEAVKRVASGRERSEQAETSIHELTHSTEQSVAAFQQINGATSQQLAGFEQISQGMGEIRTASQQTAASTAQLERSVADLNSLSAKLRSAVERYTI